MSTIFTLPHSKIIYSIGEFEVWSRSGYTGYWKKYPAVYERLPEAKARAEKLNKEREKELQNANGK